MWGWIKWIWGEKPVAPDMTYYDPYATLEKYPMPRSLQPREEVMTNRPLRDDDPVDHSATTNRDYSWPRWGD